MTAVIRPTVAITKLVDSTGANTAAVDASGHVSVVADALPLPSGAATQTTLEAIRVLEAASRVVTVASLAACRLVKGQAAGEQITCTGASTDYSAAGPMPAGTRYVTVYCAAECKVAVGEATSTSIGYRQGSGAVTYPTTVAATPGADDTVHVQSVSVGAVVTLTYGKD